LSASPRYSLLQLDPQLGQLLPRGRLAEAQSALGVRVARLPRGKWDTDGIVDGRSEHVGLLVLEGVVAHDVLMDGQASTELLGPGDLLRPWTREPAPLLRRGVRWHVLSDTRAALLDRQFAWQLGGWPEVNAMLMERLSERTERLAATLAITKLTRVDRRVLAFLWHLAERWGRMTPGGVLLPLTLSHRMLGQIVGARRPTVTAAVSALVEAGEIVRRADGAWLLTSESRLAAMDGDRDGEPAPLVAPRRHVLVGRD